MKVEELLRGQWFEFSGGSRPNSNKISFSRLPDNSVTIDIFYVFDWERNETENLGFLVDGQTFMKFIEELLSTGSAALYSKSETQELSLECRLTSEGFQFRLSGQTVLSWGGPIGFQMEEFAEVACGALMW